MSDENDIDISRLQIMSDGHDIVGILNRIKEKKQKVTLWQNIDGERLICQALISVIDLVQKTITLSPELGSNFNFEKQLAVYFHGDDYSFLFKEKSKLVKKNFIIINIPSEARFLDKRNLPRFRMPEGQRCQVRVRLADVPSGKGIGLIFPLSEISQAGIGLAIKPSQYPKIQYAKSYEIVAFNNFELPFPIQTEMVYLVPYRGIKPSPETFRLGLKFRSIIEPTLLEKIIKGKI